MSKTYALFVDLLITSVEVTAPSVSCDIQVSNGIFFPLHLHVIRNKSVEICLAIFKKKGIHFFFIAKLFSKDIHFLWNLCTEFTFIKISSHQGVCQPKCSSGHLTESIIILNFLFQTI